MMNDQFGSEMLTSVKYARGTSDLIKQRFKAADDLYSKAVSRVRQTLEALFAW
jgi:hypothetical protein